MVKTDGKSTSGKASGKASGKSVIKGAKLAELVWIYLVKGLVNND